MWNRASASGNDIRPRKPHPALPGPGPPVRRDQGCMIGIDLGPPTPRGREGGQRSLSPHARIQHHPSIVASRQGKPDRRSPGEVAALDQSGTPSTARKRLVGRQVRSRVAIWWGAFPTRSCRCARERRVQLGDRQFSLQRSRRWCWPGEGRRTAVLKTESPGGAHRPGTKRQPAPAVPRPARGRPARGAHPQ